jgi:NAD(P)H dehydrogenase (quinone)
MSKPGVILVTGAAGRVGSVGRRVVELLRESDLPVRALVRRDDERAEYLRGLGADVVVADLTRSEEVVLAVQGCRLIFFSISVSSEYLVAATVMAAAAKASDIDLIVNLSQMTMATMNLTHVTESPQHRTQWLSEQIFNWSAVPVVHLRPTVFIENPFFWGLAAKSIADCGKIILPFGKGRTSPIAANDVAEVAVAVLRNPLKYAGKSLELTGPRSADMYEYAKEYSAALGRSVSYEDIALETWKETILKALGLPDHVFKHIATMAKLHAAGDYDRVTTYVPEILGREATSLSAAIKLDRNAFPL